QSGLAVLDLTQCCRTDLDALRKRPQAQAACRSGVTHLGSDRCRRAHRSRTHFDPLFGKTEHRRLSRLRLEKHMHSQRCKPIDLGLIEPLSSSSVTCTIAVTERVIAPTVYPMEDNMTEVNAPAMRELLGENTPSNWGKWGPDDELGALNYLDAAEVLRGVQHVKSGETFTLQIHMGREIGRAHV